jgi:hypothetical protein
MNREQILTALFNLLIPVAGFQTTGRRLVHWGKVAAFPALFLRNPDDDYPPRAIRGLPAKVTLHAEAWIYSASGPDDAPITPINNIIDAVELALKPPPIAETQTLGGLVSHCWIEGKIVKDPGDLDNIAKVLIPINILV